MKFSDDQHALSRRRFLASVAAGAAGCALGRLAWAETAAAVESHEAAFYEPLENKGVRCRLCPWGCVTSDGQRGRCRVRENRGGRYYSLVYGRPCAKHVDPIEKKPFFHVYPGTLAYSLATVGCNIACKFCQNWDISQASPEDVKPEWQSPADIARAAKGTNCKTIAYTYNEPTIFHEYVVDCAKAGREQGIESVVVSNGFISAAPLKIQCGLVKAVKIDLKAFTQQFYEDVCSGMLQPVLDSLKCLADSGVWYEIVVLIIPTLNDSADEIKRMSAWIVKELGPDVPVHFTRYHPMYKIKNIPPTPPETLHRARQVALAQGCHFVYIGNLPGGEGESTLCPGCGAVAVKRYGYRILENNLVNGACRACGKKIPGVWA